MPPLTSATADDWLKLALTWQWLNLARVSPTGEAVWTARSFFSARLVARGPLRRLPPPPPHPRKTSLMWKPGSPITPPPPSSTLQPHVFPPSLPFLGPNGLGDGLYFAPQKHIVFFSTAGYSICKRSGRWSIVDIYHCRGASGKHVLSFKRRNSCEGWIVGAVWSLQQSTLIQSSIQTY